MRRIIILCVCFFCFMGITYSGYSQDQVLDSLQREIARAENDTLKYWWMIQRAKREYRLKKEGTLEKMIRLKEDCQEKKYYNAGGNAATAVSAIYFDRGDYIKSIVYDEEALKMYLSLPEGDDRNWGVAACNINLGGTYSLINDWDGAQRSYYAGIAELEKQKDTTAINVGYFNLAFLFIDMQEWDKAYSYMLKAIQFRKGRENYDNALQTTARLAAICCKLGRLKEASNWLKQCDSILLLPVIDLGRLYYHNAYGDFHFANNNLDRALDFHRVAYQYALLRDDPYFIVDEEREIGKIHLLLNRRDSAEYYLTRAFNMAKQYNYLPKVRVILNDWCDYYVENGQYEKAYEYRTYLNKFTDSLTSIQNHNRILLNDARYQSERKEKQITELEQQKKIQALSIRQQATFNYVLLGSLLALLIIGLLAYRYYRNKQLLLKQTEQLQAQRIRELEKEKQLISMNSLLKGQEEERSRMARDLHDGLGGMLSGVKLSLEAMKGNYLISEDNAKLFTRALEQLDSSIGEMRRVAHNMMPEALVRLGLPQAVQDYCGGVNESNQLKVTCQIHGMDERLDPTTEIVVYRIIQELLNNIVKHAQASEALVQVMRQDNRLSITVEDNGKGFDPSLVSAQGAGLSNVRSRVDYLKGEMDLRSEPGKGCSIHIECNLSQNEG